MYWDTHDKYMLSLKELYNKTSKQTQNRLQEMFDSFDFNSENLYSIANTETKKRVNTYIEGWKEQNLLTGYFGMLAKNIYAKTRVKNSEILELLIYGAYMEEQAKLQDKELSILYNDANYYYQEGQKEVIKVTKSKQEPSILEEALFLYLLDQPNYSGFSLNQQIQATIQYNAQQVYRQAVILLQQQKTLKTNSDELKNLIARQNNTKLKIKDNKISGSMDLNGVGLNNEAKIEGIKKISEDETKVKFIAVMDEVTTDMCQSLNGQEFYINKENEFERYSKTSEGIVKCKCNGLVLGLNLPPINDNFHYCRSYIIYLPVEKEEETEYNIVDYVRKNKITNNKILDKSIKKAINLLPKNMQELIKDTKLKTSKNNSCYNRNNDTIYLLKDSNKYEVLHEIGHAIETKLDILHDKKYIEVQKNGLENIDLVINSETLKEYDNNMFINNTGKFISDYQRRIYDNDIDKNYIIDYNTYKFNTRTLGEYFSEGFRCYFENNKLLKNKDIELYNYIKEILK